LEQLQTHFIKANKNVWLKRSNSCPVAKRKNAITIISRY